jgi:hypothetical protein
MKTALFFLASSLSLLLNAQFNESFFERLGPFSNKPGHFYGTAITNGALGVRLADSVDTEVQWVKLDLNGNFQTFSAHLPTDYISPNERIIEVYEIGNNQFIVSQDSASNNSEGLKVYKYQNYTQSAGFLDFSVQLRNAYFQSYYKFGKIYIFYVESNVGMKMLKINPETLAIEENLFLGALDYPTQNIQRHYKQTHVLFENENNMQVFCHSGTNLVRIKVVNNLASPIEMNDLGIIKVFGVNHSTNQIICLKNSLTHRAKKYLNTENFNELQLVDSLDLPQISAPVIEWKYANNDSDKELFLHTSYGNGKINLFENNLLIENKEKISIENVSNLLFLNEKPLIFAQKQNDIYFETYNSLAISFGEIEKLFEFKEYNGIHDFGDYSVKFGVGLNQFEPINGSTTGDYLFTKMIYGSGVTIRVKEMGVYLGEDVYVQNGSYKVGPYTNISNYNHDIIHNFSESFYVDRALCNQHVFAISTNLPNYQMPKGIKNWPAHGDVSLGQAQNLAPFIDINQNGIYEPEQGEYPSFPGTRCLLNITHQHESDWGNIGTGLELHSYLYNFDCEDSISEVLFYKTELYNRTNVDYDSVAVGIYNDYDLGGYNDDYVGTHVETGMIYAYNGDNNDEGSGGFEGFGDSLPTIGNLFLKGVKFSNNLIDDEIGVSHHQTINGFGFNDGIVDNEFYGLQYSFYFSGAGVSATQSDPITSEQYFNYLNGKWRFGDTLYYGGTGFQGSNGVTSIPTRYSFSGNSDPLHYGTNGIDPGFEWSEESNNNPPGDRRILGSFGSTPMQAGEKLEYHFAYLAGKRVPGFGQSQLDLFAKARHVKNAFNSNLTSCGQTFDNLTQEEITSVAKIDTKNLIKLYPNPSSDKINIVIPQNTDFQIEIIDISGKSLFKEQLVSGINEIDVKDFKRGIYFVKFISGNSIETIKFIKN